MQSLYKKANYTGGEMEVENICFHKKGQELHPTVPFTKEKYLRKESSVRVVLKMLLNFNPLTFRIFLNIAAEGSVKIVEAQKVSE
jgi:hypothetical protein